MLYGNYEIDDVMDRHQGGKLGHGDQRLEKEEENPRQCNISLFPTTFAVLQLKKK